MPPASAPDTACENGRNPRKWTAANANGGKASCLDIQLIGSAILALVWFIAIAISLVIIPAGLGRNAKFAAMGRQPPSWSDPDGIPLLLELGWLIFVVAEVAIMGLIARGVPLWPNTPIALGHIVTMAMGREPISPVLIAVYMALMITVSFVFGYLMTHWGWRARLEEEAAEEAE